MVLTVYEAWGTIQGGASVFIPAAFAQSHRKVLEYKPLVALYSVRAASWGEAMQVYYDNQDWGTYRQMVG